MINKNTKYAMEELLKIKKLETKERGIFISRDCIVTETFTGKTYKYKAYNYLTGDNKYLGYKRNAVNADGYINLLEKLADQNFYNISYPTDGEKLIEYIFEIVFKNDGFKLRKEQVDLSKEIYKTMIGKMILLSDVPVGLGKTHAYLVAGIVYHIIYKPKWNEKHDENEPIIISTSSKRLQREIINEYIPEISKKLLERGIIDKRIKSIIRKGKGNYICDIRLNNHVKSLKNRNPDEYKILESLIGSMKVDLSDVSIRNYDIERIKVISNHCKSCPPDKACRYRKMLGMANMNDIAFIVTNHHYMIADSIKRKNIVGRPLLNDYKAVVYDEGHKILDAFITMTSVKIEKRDLLELIKKAKPSNSGNKVAKELKKYCMEMHSIAEVIFYRAEKGIEINDGTLRYEIIERNQMKTKLYDLKRVVKQIVIRINEKNRNIQIAFERLGDVLDVMLGKSIMWIEEPRKTNVAVYAVSKNIEEILYDTLFRSDVSSSITSGTLSVNGDFDYTKKTLGLSNQINVNEVYKESPFNYKENTLLYIEKNLPYPNHKNSDYIEELAVRVEELINATNGHSLVLFTSYEVMRKVYGILKRNYIKYPLFQLSKGNGKAIDDYRKSENGILFGCGSAWEGLNFSGDILSHLIIVKLPFQVPDPITENHKKEFDNEDEFRKKILTPQMLTKLKQGYGRAIRNETDTAVISILDVRASKKYKLDILNALPRCNVTNQLEDIKTFIQDKKLPEYFLCEGGRQ